MWQEITIIDIVNCIIATSSLILSVRKSIIDKRPYIKLNRIFFDPKDYHFYTGESIRKVHLDIIKNTIDENLKFSKQMIDGEEYLFVNLLPRNADIKNVRLVLAPYQVSYINTGSFVNEINMKAAKIKLKNERQYRNQVIDYQITPYKDRDYINLKIAYACLADTKTSVNYEKLIDKDYFDYKKDFNIAKDIINIAKESYIIECNKAGEKFYIELIFELKNTELKFRQKYIRKLGYSIGI